LSLLVVAVFWFFCGGYSAPIHWTIILILLLVPLAIAYRSAMRQAAALEFLLLTRNVNRVKNIGKRFVESSLRS